MFVFNDSCKWVFSFIVVDYGITLIIVSIQIDVFKLQTSVIQSAKLIFKILVDATCEKYLFCYTLKIGYVIKIVCIGLNMDIL